MINDDRRKKAIKIILIYTICFIIGFGVFFLVLVARNYFTKDYTLVEKYRHLTDAFTFPAVLFLGAGVLVFLSNEGALSALGWMLKKVFRSLVPGMGRQQESYQDYLANRKKVHNYSFLFIVGIAFLILTIIFMILFYQNY